MKKLTAEDLFALEHGDRVLRFNGTKHRRLTYVGRMPRSKNYLIFCDGQHLEHLYISTKDNTFYSEWYGGEYDGKFVGNLLVEKYKKKIEDVEYVYLTDD